MNNVTNAAGANATGSLITNMMGPIMIRTTSWMIAWTACLLLAGSATVRAQETKAAATTTRELLTQAYALSQSAQTEAQLNEVMARCDQALKTNPTKVNHDYANNLISWSLNRRGELRSEEAKEEDALKDFERAIQLNPNNWRALHNRGVSQAMNGKNKEALADFNRAIELEPNYANSQFNRGEVYSALGNFPAAIEDYSKAIRLNAKDPSFVTNRGYAYYRLRQYERALADYAKALTLDKEWVPAYVHRGSLHGDRGQWKEAVQDYRTAIQTSPDYGLAFQQIAWLLATCPDATYRDPKIALDSARRAIEIDGEGDFHYLDTLAAALAANGQFEQAIETLKKAITSLPDGYESFKVDLESRLKLYEKKEAFVEKATGKEESAGKS